MKFGHKIPAVYLICIFNDLGNYEESKFGSILHKRFVGYMLIILEITYPVEIYMPTCIRINCIITSWQLIQVGVLHVLIGMWQFMLPRTFTLHTKIKSKTHRRVKPRSPIQKSPISYTKMSYIIIIRNLNLHLPEVRIDLMFPSETEFCQFIPVNKFTISGYFLLHIKENPQSCRVHEFAAYIKNVFSCGRDSTNEDHESPFCVALLYSLSFVFTIR